MRLLPPLVVSCVLGSVTPLFAATQIYRYTDDAGTITFTNEVHHIPEQYRPRAVPLYTEITGMTGVVTPAPPEFRPEPMTRVVTVSSDYRMGAHDTRTDAIRMALESAKRQALEQVATYLESFTEIRNLDITRDELRTFTAGSIMVLDQQTSTRIDPGAVVIHVDLTAQVDRTEVIQAITALRTNDSLKQELMALQTEADRLRRQLDAANQALAMAQEPEQIEALRAERRQVLDRMQADSLRTAEISAVQNVSIYPMIGGLIVAPRPFPQNPPPAPPIPAPDEFPSAAAQTRLREAITLPAQPLIPAFPQIQPLGVPHGSLTQTPSLSSPAQAAPPARPVFPSTGRFYSGPTGGQSR